MCGQVLRPAAGQSYFRQHLQALDLMIDTPITSGSRALDLFTDRTDLIRTFASLVNEPSSSASIIYLQGDGGVGKTLLLKFLRRYVCKRLAPETWHNILTKN